MNEIALERGLPANLDAERLVLGAILTDKDSFALVASELAADDFSLEKHRRIFTRMNDLHERGDPVDRVTLAEELVKHGQLESVDGLTGITSLDDGLPQLYHLEEYARIVADKALTRRLIFSSQALIDRAMAGAEGGLELVESATSALMELGDSGAKGALKTPAEILEDYEGGLNAFLDPSKRIKGVSTGYVKIDEMTGGMLPGELIILAARPAMGKTALALNIAWHVASHPNIKKTVAVFSLEMSKEALLTRMVCAAARVDQQKFRAGYLNKDERLRLFRATTDFNEAPLYIDDSGDVNLMDVHAKLRRLKSRDANLGLVIIDYLQLMSGGRRFENRVAEVGHLSRGLKILAKELEVPMLVLSQLSRAPEQRTGDPVPRLSDLRESGTIEQDADMVWFIFREEYYKPDREDLKGLADLIIGKQRNGPVGRAKLAFIREFTKFENLASDVGDDQGELI